MADRWSARQRLSDSTPTRWLLDCHPTGVHRVRCLRAQCIDLRSPELGPAVVWILSDWALLAGETAGAQERS